MYSYVLSAQLFEKFLAAKKLPTTVLDITPAHVQAFQVDTLRKNKPTTAMVRFKSLAAVLEVVRRSRRGRRVTDGSQCKRRAEGQAAQGRGPSDRRRERCQPQEARQVLPGTDAEDRRDLAMVRMFLSTGCRLSELTNLTIEDIDQREREILVTGKGNRIRTVRYGVKAAEALNTHLRELKRRGIADRSGLDRAQRSRADAIGHDPSSSATLPSGRVPSAPLAPVPAHCRRQVVFGRRLRGQRHETLRMEHRHDGPALWGVKRRAASPARGDPARDWRRRLATKSR